MLAQKKSSSFKSKLTLAYDSSCGMCVETARMVQDVSIHKIEVSPLNSDYVVEAFNCNGMDVSFDKPVLVVERAENVKIYDGFRLGVILSKHLGVKKTWKVLELLGDRKNYANSGQSFSRKSFLKGALGLYRQLQF